MMRKLIAFIGTGNYEKVKYRLGEHEEWSRFPFYLLYKVYNPEEVYIISTKEGHNKWFEYIKKKFEAQKLKKIEIPILKKNEDIWILHNIIEKIISEGDEVIMDITYTFRHIPVMSFASLIYEFRIRNVKILGMYYGAIEASNNCETPIFDLTGAIELVKWHYALLSFIEYGRSEELKIIADELRRKNIGNKDKLKVYNILSKIMGLLDTISDSLYMNQNLEVLEKLHSLKIIIEENQDLLSKYLEREYPPLKEIIEGKLRKFGEMGYPNPREKLNTNILEKLMKLGTYQAQINLLGESISTLREWVVSYAIYICQYNLEKWYDYENVRGKMSYALNKLIKGDISGDEEIIHIYECLKNADIGNKLRDLWSGVREIRNWYAHAGINKGGLGTIKTVKEKIMSKYENAEELMEVKK